jgi:hypothetical protein
MGLIAAKRMKNPLAIAATFSSGIGSYCQCLPPHSYFKVTSVSRHMISVRTLALSVALTIVTCGVSNAQDRSRTIIGFIVIEPGTLSLTYDSVVERSDATFTEFDADDSLGLSDVEIREWRDELSPGAHETALKSLVEISPDDLLALLDANGDGAVTRNEARALALYDSALLDADSDGVIGEAERRQQQLSGLSVWAERPCLEFGMAEGMLLGAFCGK